MQSHGNLGHVVCLIELIEVTDPVVVWLAINRRSCRLLQGL